MVGLNTDRHGRTFAIIMKNLLKFQIMTTGFSQFGDFTMQVRESRTRCSYQGIADDVRTFGCEFLLGHKLRNSRESGSRIFGFLWFDLFNDFQSAGIKFLSRTAAVKFFDDIIISLFLYVFINCAWSGFSGAPVLFARNVW